MNVPIITLSIENMQHTMSMMLSEHAAAMDAQLQQAVKDFCQPERLAALVKQEADRALEQTLKAAIGQYFSYNGPGERAVQQAVKEHFHKKYGGVADPE